MDTFQTRQHRLKVAFREAGVELPNQVRANMTRVLKRVKEIALSNVRRHPDLDPESIIEAIDAADRSHRALTRFKDNL